MTWGASDTPSLSPIAEGEGLQTIPLTRGMAAIVDGADFEWLSQYRWRAHSSGKGIFYAGRSVWATGRGQVILMHREILNAPEGVFVDHINGDKLDNRRINLRLCNRSQNRWNTGPRKGSSPYKGVSRHSKNPKWMALIAHGGRTRYLGSFDNEVDAARAYDAEARRVAGEFAHLNFPEEHL